MDAEAIDAVLGSLEEYRWGWRAVLPGVRFIGQPIELRVDTQPVPTNDPSPALDAAEMALVRLILGSLPALIAEVERQYLAYNADFPEVIERVHEPRVWLCRDVLAEEGPGRWSFVVGIRDAPDWGIHSDYDGLAFERIWSGD